MALLIASCDKEVSHSPVAPSPSAGKIIVNSNPDGFTIYQNGRNTGRHTPDSLTYLESGEYEITLKRLYWKDTMQVVNLTEEKPADLDIDYVPNKSMYGKLLLYSDPPGGKIIINDSLYNNVTPDTIGNILPGIYRVTYKIDNHRDAIFNAIVESGKLKSYSAELKDTTVWLDYRTSNSGIQSNQISSITIDHSGIKWMGSLDNGLISFDDRVFTNFNTTNSAIPNNKVNCVSVDAQNNIWVGTPSGIGVFNGTSWTTYDRFNSGLSSQIVNIIRFDSEGNAWIGTTNNLTKFDGNNWIQYNYSLGHDYIDDIYIDSSNRMWLATNSSGIYFFENEIFYPFTKEKHGYPSFSVSSVSKDNAGNIWFCFVPDSVDPGGIAYWDGAEFNTLFNGAQTDYINNVYIDGENNKWISSSIGFIWYNDQNIPEIYTTFNSLITVDNTYASVRDKNGILWIATYQGGLNKFKVNNL